MNALYDAGIPFNDVNPDYVVVGETTGYNYEMIIKATQLINQGAKLIATNSDLTGPSDRGIIPACRALVAPIELATGVAAYFIGKPNPLMMRTGLKKLGVHSGDAVMIGDRMDTDIIAGVETGMETALVLSGVTTRSTMKHYSYQPHYVLNGIGDIVPKNEKETCRKGGLLLLQVFYLRGSYLAAASAFSTASQMTSYVSPGCAS